MTARVHNEWYDVYWSVRQGWREADEFEGTLAYRHALSGLRARERDAQSNQRHDAVAEQRFL